MGIITLNRNILKLLLIIKIITFTIGIGWLLFLGTNKNTLQESRAIEKHYTLSPISSSQPTFSPSNYTVNNNNTNNNSESNNNYINNLRFSVKRTFSERDYESPSLNGDMISRVNLNIIHNIKHNIDKDIEKSFGILINNQDNTNDKTSDNNREIIIKKLLENKSLLKEKINNFFYHRTWNSFVSPFDYLTIPVDYFLQHTSQYEKALSYENSYMLRLHQTNTIINNEFSEILQKLAIGLVGEECFNKKLIFFGENSGFFHPGGPRKVGIGISNVLKLIGKDFKFISDARDEENLKDADFIYAYQPHLSKEITFQLLTRYMKPKLFIGPTIAPEVIRDDYLVLKDRLTYIAASTWVKYSDYAPKVNGLKITVHPTTIHTTIWSPSPSSLLSDKEEDNKKEEQVEKKKKKKNEILFYNKYCRYDAHHIEKQLREIIEKEKDFNDIKIRTIEYGNYNEKEFWKILREDISYALICAGTETQGIAIEEIMSMNIPVFAIWEVDKPSPYTLTVVPYFEEGISGMVSKPEDVTMKLPIFLRRAINGEFKPREMIVKYFNFFNNAIEFLNILCHNKARFDIQ